jgi:carbon starvation protein CstA
MALGFTFSTEEIPGGVNITYFIMIAVIAGFVYYALRSITTNKYIIIAIAIALALFTGGYLQEIGEVMLALGVSRLMEQELNVLTS